MTDEDNKLLLIDYESMQIFNAVNIGKKILHSYAETFIYIALSNTEIQIYGWNGVKISSIQPKIPIQMTNMLEVGSKLVITDCFGEVSELQIKQIKQGK